MQIAINEKNEIVGYATFGKLQNGIECFVDIPSDYTPKKYKLVTDETEDGTTYSVEPNPDYVEPIEEEEATQDEINFDFDFRLSCLELGL